MISILEPTGAPPKHKGVAAIVKDLGKQPLDPDFTELIGGNVQPLSGGQVCCQGMFKGGYVFCVIGEKSTLRELIRAIRKNQAKGGGK